MCGDNNNIISAHHGVHCVYPTLGSGKQPEWETNAVHLLCWAILCWEYATLTWISTNLEKLASDGNGSVKAYRCQGKSCLECVYTVQNTQYTHSSSDVLDTGEEYYVLCFMRYSKTICHHCHPFRSSPAAHDTQISSRQQMLGTLFRNILAFDV